MGRAAAKSMANSVSSPIKSPEMADLVLEYDNYYGQQCAEAIGARLNYPAFMNIISNPVRMPHRDRTSHWITWILPNIMWYPYTAERRDLIGKYIPRGRGFCPRDCLRLISRAKGCKIPALGKFLGRKEKTFNLWLQAVHYHTRSSLFYSVNFEAYSSYILFINQQFY